MQSGKKERKVSLNIYTCIKYNDDDKSEKMSKIRIQQQYQECESILKYALWHTND